MPYIYINEFILRNSQAKLESDAQKVTPRSSEMTCSILFSTPVFRNIRVWNENFWHRK